MDLEFLLTFFSESQPRRSHVIFAILSQKTTGSTEYWGLRYQLLDWLGLEPSLTKGDYEQRIASLLSQRLLYKIEPGIYALTEKGRRAKVAYQEKHYGLKRPFERYEHQTAQFMPVFLLANQIISEYAYKNNQYYPMQIGLKQRQLVKRWFKQQDKTTLVAEWKQGLTVFLKQLEQHQADKIAQTWIGHAMAGLNFEQMQFDSAWTAFDFYLWQLDLYTQLIDFIEQALAVSHPLNQLYQLVGHKSRLPESLLASYEAAQAGASLDQIAKQRHLKLGTVQEHLLTAAIWLPLAEFPYERYLTEPVLQYLKENLTEPDIDQWRFNMVRTSTDITEFFLFRLYEIWQTKQEQQHETI